MFYSQADRKGRGVGRDSAPRPLTVNKCEYFYQFKIHKEELKTVFKDQKRISPQILERQSIQIQIPLAANLKCQSFPCNSLFCI